MEAPINCVEKTRKCSTATGVTVSGFVVQLSILAGSFKAKNGL